MTDSKEPDNIIKAVRKSDFLLAVLAVLVLDALFRFGSSWQEHNTYKLGFDEPYRSRIWWAMKDFTSGCKTADLVLMGASDMTCAFYGAEATYLQTPQSQLLKHNSKYLEGRLAKLDSPFRSTFCLGIPGEMPSDAYFLASTILANKKKPKAICLSIAPRDFYDATFGDPTSTDIFRVANKLGLGQNCEVPRRSSIWDIVDHRFQQAFSVYGHKWELMSWQHHATHAVLSPLLREDFWSISTPQAIRKLALLELPEDYGRTEVMELPFDPKHPIWINNIAEYQSRYRQFKPSTFTQQLAYLKKLGELCRSEGVGFLVVNSPLTNENRAMIEKSAYDLYMSEIPKTVRASGGIFVNFDTLNAFQHDDFFDSIHLNGKGGQIFLDQIAIALSKSSELAASTRAFISSQRPF
ncbi:MAG: hypothetical protein C5B53_09930 [Candidatus Melainabacteria bacterium]|nr:MAG: hypothetical protein C5B53_09930 [Candidatus Melainabacteria bacterium]